VDWSYLVKIMMKIVWIGHIPCKDYVENEFHKEMGEYDHRLSEQFLACSFD
jgi:hypothetical protein